MPSNTLHSPLAMDRKYTTPGTSSTILHSYVRRTRSTIPQTGGTRLRVQEIVRSPSSSEVGSRPPSPDVFAYIFISGVALYIYGASKDELEAIAGGEYLHGHQEVCINLRCHAIDNHQTYLNIRGAARYQPVLLWSGEGFSPRTTNRVHIRLIDPESPVGHVRGVSFERAVYTEVRPASYVSWAPKDISQLTLLGPGCRTPSLWGPNEWRSYLLKTWLSAILPSGKAVDPRLGHSDGP